MNQTTTQLIGFISFAMGMLCFYQKDDKKLKALMTLMYLNHALHFALLGAVTACLSSLLSVLRSAIALKTQSLLAALSFIAITLAWGAYLSDNLLDMLPIMGACIGTYSIFRLDGIAMRVGFLLGSSCWLANNIIVGSIGTSLLESVLIAVNLFTIYRLLIANRQ